MSTAQQRTETKTRAIIKETTARSITIREMDVPMESRAPVTTAVHPIKDFGQSSTTKSPEKLVVFANVRSVLVIQDLPTSG